MPIQSKTLELYTNQKYMRITDNSNVAMYVKVSWIKPNNEFEVQGGINK